MGHESPRRRRAALEIACASMLLANAACDQRKSSPAAGRDAGSIATDEAEPSFSSSTIDSATTWKELCDAAKGVDVPPADRAAPARADFKPGDSIRYYYGVARDPDYVRARQAAFAEREQQNGAFTASTVLMMLYANGFGVPRNLELAIHIACEIGEGESEIKDRVRHLNSMRTMQKPQVFDFCDDASGGVMEGHCAAIAEQRKSGLRNAELTRITESWSSEQKLLFERLQSKLESYASARSSYERDLSAADRSSVMTEEQGQQRERFLESLKALERGELPKYDEAAYAEIDASLNRVYKEALKRARVDTTVNAKGITATEKTWISYRDAWVQFGAKRYPSVPAEAWKAWLSKRRIEELGAL